MAWLFSAKKWCAPFLPGVNSVDTSDARENTIIIVPGSVFDKKGNRIGYGGGFYDRFLAKQQGLYSIGLAYACQMTDEIPADTWDRSVDMVITDEETYQ